MVKKLWGLDRTTDSHSIDMFAEFAFWLKSGAVVKKGKGKFDFVLKKAPHYEFLNLGITS
jgi:hypothetical protein